MELSVERQYKGRGRAGRGEEWKGSEKLPKGCEVRWRRGKKLWKGELKRGGRNIALTFSISTSLILHNSMQRHTRLKKTKPGHQIKTLTFMFLHATYTVHVRKCCSVTATHVLYLCHLVTLWLGLGKKTKRLSLGSKTTQSGLDNKTILSYV